MIAYGNFIDDPKMLGTNIIYNFGLMYNSIKNAVVFFLGYPRPGVETTYDVGFELGSVFFYFLLS